MIRSKIRGKIYKAGIVLCSALFAFCPACSLNPEAGIGTEIRVELSETAIELRVGETYTLEGVVSDGDSLQWSSSRENVASVSGGRIRALSEGTTKISAYCAHAQAYCTVTVLPAPEGSNPGNQPDDKPAEKVLVWSDEFDGNALDRKKWNYQLGTHDVYHDVVSWVEGWGNNEWQYYTEEAVSVSDGLLEIKATREQKEGKDYTSGRIVTRDLATFTYGYIEARIKLPAVAGMWPAFWMLPQPTDFSSTDNVYGGWAANGELDIMEAKGRLPKETSGALHFGGDWTSHVYRSGTCALQTPMDEWHVYAVEWRADHITWLVDGKEFLTVKSSQWYTVASDKESAPFDQPFYLLLNLAVGGNFDPAGSQQLANNASFTSASMYVDYVRVYE